MKYYISLSPQYFEPACRVFTIYSYPSSVLHTTVCFTTSGAIYLCELHSFRYSVHFCFRLHIKSGNSLRISFSRQQFLSTRISSEFLTLNLLALTTVGARINP